MTKTCASCGETKPLEGFHKNRSRKDGVNGFCKTCMTEKCSKSYSKKKEEYLTRNRAWRNKNKERHAFLSAAWNENNKERCRENRRAWALSNIEKSREKVARRYASRTGATPPWITKEHREKMLEIYWLAADLYAISGQKYQVDHIIPLRGKDVCGLHVPWNLQVLPDDVNQKKATKYEP